MAEQLALNFEFRATLTFDDFFPGANQEIIRHLQDFPTKADEQLIFIYGAPGSGKSHLLQACCQWAYQQQQKTFFFCLSKDCLPYPELLLGLENFPLVCFDNIDIIAGIAAWEHAFFNFFNLHRNNGGKLLLSATLTPKDISIQLPDLKTRLNWGLTLKLKPLADDDKINALIFRANRMGFVISLQVAKFLMTHYDRDMANLWSLLEQLDRASLAAQRKLTIPFLKDFFDRQHGQ